MSLPNKSNQHENNVDITVKQPLKSFHLQLQYKDFICGAGASLVNTTLTYPISKIIFRQQIHNVSTLFSLHQISKEGIRFLYRGLMFPIFQRSANMSVMFGTYHNLNRSFAAKWPNGNTFLILSTAAFISGGVEAILTPFERLQSLMQHSRFNNRVRNSFKGIKIISSYGLKEFYRGFTAILLRNGPSNILFFGLKNYFSDKLDTRNAPPHIEVLFNFLIGACLGAVLSTMFYPLNVVKNRMQTRLGGKFVSPLHEFISTYRMRGNSVLAMYKGVHLNYTRAILSWGIINTVYEFLLKNL